MKQLKFLLFLLSLFTVGVSAQQGGGGVPNGSPFSIQYKNGTLFGGTGPGTSGQVLTSRGAGLSPTFQAAAAGGASFAIGDVVYGNAAPTDGGTWLQLNGQSVSQATYASLFTILGHNYLQYKATVGTNPGFTNSSTVVYDGTKWIGITASSTSTFTSSDGLTWVAGGALNTALASPIIWSNGSGTVLVFNAATTTANISTDHGATWSGVTLPSTGSWGIAANGTNLIGAKAGSTGLIASIDGGATWSAVAAALPVTPTTFLGINYDGTQWVIYGVNATAATQHLKTAVADGQSGWTNTYSAAGIPFGTNAPVAIPGSGTILTTSGSYGVITSSDSGFTYSPTNYTQVQTSLNYSNVYWDGLNYVFTGRTGAGQYHLINSTFTSIYMFSYLVSGTASTPLVGFTSSNVINLSLPVTSVVNFYQPVDKTNHRSVLLIQQDLTGGGTANNIYAMDPAINISTNFMLPNITYGAFTSTNPFPFPKAWIKAL